MLRIRKNEARKLFNCGDSVYLVACKMNPESPWVGYVEVKKDSDKLFDDVVNEFEYYNCNYTTGRYAHFYKDETKISLHN